MAGEYELGNGIRGENLNFTFPAVEKQRHFPHRRQAPSLTMVTPTPKTTKKTPQPPTKPLYLFLNIPSTLQNLTISQTVLEVAPAGRYRPVITSAMAFPHRRRTSAPPAEAENDAGRPTATSIDAQCPPASISVAAARQKCVRWRHLGGGGGGCGAGGAMVLAVVGTSQSAESRFLPFGAGSAAPKGRNR